MLRQIDHFTVARLYDIRQRGEINLDPPYQRRSVWDVNYQRYFVDSILRNYPVPAIFVYKEAKTVDKVRKELYNIVDGKQRLTAIFDFIDGKFELRGDEDAEWFKKKFEELPTQQQDDFWDYQFLIEYIPVPDTVTINDIFDRINRNVAALKPQELRHARYSGIFIKQVEESAHHMLATLPEGIFPKLSVNQICRMEDCELVAELLLLLEDGIQSSSSESLDQAFKSRDESWPAQEGVVTRFNKVIEYMRSLLEERNGGNTLQHSRLRNLTDFYPFFGAIDAVLQDENAVLVTPRVVQRLNAFTEQVKEPKIAEAKEYAVSVRGGSNDGKARKFRQDLLISVIRGDWDVKLQLPPIPLI